MAVSLDGAEWQTVATVTDGRQDEDRILAIEPVTARHVRVTGRARATEWGYSIWEIDAR